MTFSVWGRYLAHFVALGLIVFAPPILLLLLAEGPGPGSDPMSLVLLLTVLMDGPFRAAVAYAVMRDRNDKRASLPGCLGAARRCFWPVIGTSLIVSLSAALVGVPWFLVSAMVGPWFALPLLLLPIWALVVFSVAVQVAALELCESVPHALGRSLNLTRGRRMGVAVVVLVLFLVIEGVRAAFGYVGADMRLYVAAFLLLAPLPAVALGAVYQELLRTFVPPTAAT